MGSKLQVICILLSVAAGYSLVPSTHSYVNSHDHHKRDSSGGEDDTLQTSLIIVFSLGITVGLLFVMVACAVCMLHRARGGKFCCLKAKIRYRQHSVPLECDDSIGDDNEQEQTLPPQYDGEYLLNESPPVYEDALQDVVIATGIRASEVQLPPYPLSYSHSSVTQIINDQEERQQNMPITFRVSDTSSVTVFSNTTRPNSED